MVLHFVKRDYLAACHFDILHFVKAAIGSALPLSDLVVEYERFVNQRP